MSKDYDLVTVHVGQPDGDGECDVKVSLLQSVTEGTFPGASYSIIDVGRVNIHPPTRTA